MNRFNNKDSDLTAAMTRASSTPLHLRAQAGVKQGDMAVRMRMRSSELRTLETTSVELWEVNTLRAYLKALGYELSLFAVRDGRLENVT